MEKKASYGRKLGNTFPVALYIRTAVLEGKLEDHEVSVSLRNETKGIEVPVPCVVDGNTVKFSFTKDLQYRAGGEGFYTPRIIVDAGDDNVGDADWYCGIEIVKHSVQEYSNRSAGMNVGPVALEGDMSLIANGLSAYEMWKADGHEGTLSQFIVFITQPAIDAAEACAAAEALRVAQENIRKSDEITRQLNEQNRQSKESEREIAAAEDSERAASDHSTATSDHTQAGADHTRAESDHTTAESDHSRAGTDHTRAEGDHSTAGLDHSQAGSDHTRAESDHGTATADHSQAGSDHTRAESDHGTATADHSQAGSDHTRAESDHDTAAADHSQAGLDHTRAESDHGTATSDHSQAGSDHTRAESDHSTSEQSSRNANDAAAAAQAVVADAAAIREAAEAATEAATAANAAAQALSGAVADVAALREDVDELMLGSHDHMAAAWAEGQTSPAAVKTAGDSSIIDYDMFLIDHTRNSESVSHPVGKLKKNNYLRFEEGGFAPAVGITQAMYEECMTHALYKDGELYCASGAFDPVAFYALCSFVVGQDGITRLSHPTLLKDSTEGDEVGHYLMPWETVSTNYSLQLGLDHSVFMLQNVKGTSGRVWNFLSTVRKSWDGRESVELKPTAFSPCPVGVVVDGDSKRHSRTMFCIYDGPSAANCAGSRGTGNIISMFYQKGRMMPAAAVMNQVTTMQYARNDNPSNTGPTPFAEGGFHTLNTFLTWLEIKYGTRYLHANAKFGSGISSNDSCTSEATFLSNGGVRCRKVGGTDWTYQTLAAKPSIIRKNASAAQFDDWSSAINGYYPKEAVMESQMAASFAVEAGVAAGDSFEFYGNVYTWGVVTGAEGLDNGRMNAIIRSVRTATVSAYDSEGNAQDFEVEVSLRMSLFEGANISGDVYMYWGGGMELIGTCGSNTGNGTFGHRIDVYSEPDQGKWIEDTDYSHTNGAAFDCESEYTHLGHITTVSNNYSLKDLEMAPVPTAMGGGLGQGMCHYCYMGKNWMSTEGGKARVGVRFRGYSHHSTCAPRTLHANNAAGYTNAYYCGSAQVALPESATTTQS